MTAVFGYYFCVFMLLNRRVLGYDVLLLVLSTAPQALVGSVLETQFAANAGTDVAGWALVPRVCGALGSLGSIGLMSLLRINHGAYENLPLLVQISMASALLPLSYIAYGRLAGG